MVLISLGIAAAGGPWFSVCATNVVAFSCENFIRLGVALVSGAATAWIVESEPDQDKAIGANSPGLAIGAFMAGILAQYAPSPLRLSYLVFILLLIPIAVVIWKTEETVHKPRSLGEASIVPRLAVPPEMFGTFVPAAVAAFATFIQRWCRHSSKRRWKTRTTRVRVAL